MIANFDKPWVGRGTYVGEGFKTFCDSQEKKITIGKFCSIGGYVFIMTGNGHDYKKVSTYPFQYSEEYGGQCKNWKPFAMEHPVKIGNDVWIGTGVMIREGITVGDGAVLGMGAVVVKDVQPYEIVGGVPAKHIKWRFPEEIRQGLLKIKWWDWDEETLQQRMPDMEDPVEFVKKYS